MPPTSVTRSGWRISRAYPADDRGQQQRVAIARALALEPAIMLLTKPKTPSDPEISRKHAERDAGNEEVRMTHRCGHRHEMRFAPQAADRVVFMDEGI